MSAENHGVTVLCDLCAKRFPTARHTVAGARGDAARKGWTVPILASGFPSNNPARTGDACPKHLGLEAPLEDMLPYQI